MGGTHKLLVVVVGEEHLEARWPIFAPPQEPIDTLMAAHVTVPGVLLDGCLCSPRPHQQVHALHTETPGVGSMRQVGGPIATHAHCVGDCPRVPSSPPFHPYWTAPSHCKPPHFVEPLQPHRSTPRLLPPPAAVVVAAHEHLAPTTADGAVGLVSVVIVLVRALQKAVLGMGGGTESVWTPHPIALCGAVRPPPLCTYLAVLAHSPDKQRVLQGDVEAPTGDADIWGGTQGRGAVNQSPPPQHPQNPTGPPRFSPRFSHAHSGEPQGPGDGSSGEG